MYNKIIYLFVCLLSFTSVKAQQITAIRIRNNIKTLLNSLEKDTTISGPCKKNIKNLNSSIPLQNKSNLDPKAITQLIKAGNLFADSMSILKKKCNDKRINSLLDSTNQLITELNKLVADSTMVRINFTNSSKNGTPNWKLHIDSLDIPINDIAIKDSAGNFETLLFLDANSAAKLKKDSKNLRDSNFKVIWEQNKFILRLRESKSVDTLPKANLSFEPVAAELRAMHSENKMLLILVSILFFLILIVIILHVRIYKDFNSTIKTISVLSKELKINQPMEESKNEIHIPQPVAPLIEEKLKPASIKGAELPDIISNTSDTYFICEVMMTAGPRKKKIGSDSINDIDLGEDVCGFISKTKEAFIWLLDGTSDDDPLRNPVDKREYFSARLLAQSIGDRLRNKFTENQNESLPIMIENAINEVKTNWLQIIEHLPDKEKSNLKTKIGNKNFPHCSTTALIACLQKNGDLTAYRVGDSKMLLFGASSANERNCVETPLTENHEKGVDRIFFRLEYEDPIFKIVSNNDRTVNGQYKIVYDITENKNIDTIICFSDGIGADTEQFLEQEYKNDPVKAKMEIMYQIQGTKDDKSICFIELKEKIINITAKDEKNS